MASLENIKALYEALLAGEEPPIEPQSRVEAYLYALCEQNAGGGGSGGGSGTPGAPGGYYIPSIDANGNLTWKASKSGMPAIDGSNIKGPAGEKGETGASGAKGDKGDKGDTGATGATGPAGADGKTPQKGVDYFTAADKQELVNSVLALLPTWEGGSY